MLRQLVGSIACAGLVLGGSLTLPVAPAQAQTYNSTADDACWQAVVREARGQFAADGVDQLSLDERQGAQVETIVFGSGEANGQRFDYECTYNVRTRQTYAVSLRGTGGSPSRPDRYPPARPTPRPNHGGGPSAGAILGTLIAGAIIAGATSKRRPNPPRDEWVSPYPGIQCNNREAACYDSGRFSSYWTRRTY